MQGVGDRSRKSSSTSGDSSSERRSEASASSRSEASTDGRVGEGCSIEQQGEESGRMSNGAASSNGQHEGKRSEFFIGFHAREEITCVVFLPVTSTAWDAQ